MLRYMHAERQTIRQTGRQTDRQTDIHAAMDRQTDGRTCAIAYLHPIPEAFWKRKLPALLPVLSFLALPLTARTCSGSCLPATSKSWRTFRSLGLQGFR